MQFKEYPPRTWVELLPKAPPDVRDLVRELVRYQSTHRLTAAEVCYPSLTSFVADRRIGTATSILFTGMTSICHQNNTLESSVEYSSFSCLLDLRWMSTLLGLDVRSHEDVAPSLLLGGALFTELMTVATDGPAYQIIHFHI